jgi:hypothetical protein
MQHSQSCYRICYGRERFAVDIPVRWSKDDLHRHALNLKYTFQPLFFEFYPGMFYALNNESEINMAAGITFQWRDKDYDQDHWIEHAKECEEFTGYDDDSADYSSNCEDEDEIFEYDFGSAGGKHW